MLMLSSVAFGCSPCGHFLYRYGGFGAVAKRSARELAAVLATLPYVVCLASRLPVMLALFASSWLLACVTKAKLKQRRSGMALRRLRLQKPWRKA